MPAGAMAQGIQSQSMPRQNSGLLQTGNDYLTMCTTALETKA